MGQKITLFALLLAAGLAAIVVWILVQRRRLISELRRAEARNRATLSQKGVGIALIAPDGRFLEVNSYLCEMSGYSEKELLERRIGDLTHPDERPASDAARQRLLEAPPDMQPQVVERRYLHRDGSTVWALLSVAAIRDGSGRAVSLVGIVLDITELRRAQHDLEWKTALIRTQQEATLDAILLVDPSGRILSCNERFIELWGVSREAVSAGEDEPILRSVVGKMRDPEAFLAKVRHLYEEKGERSHDELETLDGRTIDRYSAPIIGADGAYGGRIWFFRDISDRRNSENRLRESEERFRRMAETIGEAFWMSPPDASSILYVSPAFENIWGRPVGDLYADPGLWLRTTHPEDAPRVLRALEALAQGTPYDIEFRIERPDGTEAWVNDRGYPMLDGDGRVVLTSGVASDVTQRKAAEEAVRLSAKAFESIADSVMVTDARQGIVFVNQAFTTMTGYDQAEVIGKSPRFLQSGRHDAAFYAAMWREIDHTGHWRGEVWDRRRNGEVYPELLSITAVRDAAGAITHYVGVGTEISSLKAYESRLQHQAHHDVLTGLPNRVLFQERFQETLARARRGGQLAGIMLLDLDRFKTINDSLGHAAGDQLLQAVADRLRERIRETDTLARFGGDEFAVLLDTVKDQASVAVVARTLVDTLALPYQIAGHEFSVTASIGVSCYPQDGSDAESLFKNADTAMYRAKEEGRNTFRFFAEEMNARALEALTMGNDLRLALQRRELFLHYQPQYDLRLRRATGVEALVRWRHPEVGVVPPGRFIPLAEEIGLIEPIGEWVLRTACRQMKAWLDASRPLRRVAVNLSARQFRHPDLLGSISSVLEETGLPARYLELEVTESAVMEKPHEAIEVLSRLKQMGIRIAVDDFGTGYSSLSTLKRLPLDVLKIDRSFVDGLPDDQDNAAIVRAIIAMARSLRLHLIAEGIEMAEEHAFLEREGCEEGQGYLFSRPVEADALERLLGDPI